MLADPAKSPTGTLAGLARTGETEFHMTQEQLAGRLQRDGWRLLSPNGDDAP